MESRLSFYNHRKGLKAGPEGHQLVGLVTTENKVFFLLISNF